MDMTGLETASGLEFERWLNVRLWHDLNISPNCFVLPAVHQCNADRFEAWPIK
jgi:hypothetical protein